MTEKFQTVSAAERDGIIFRRSLPLQVELHEVLNAIGPAEGLECLDIGCTNAMFSYQLRRAGGHWRSLVAEAETATRILEAVESDVDVLPADDVPFKDKTFDVVVILDVLESQPSDVDMVERCHRMLKTDGRLVVCAARAKKWTLLTPIRRLLRGGKGGGYTERRLFQALRNGFDVVSVKTYTRFFSALTDVIVQSLARWRCSQGMLPGSRFYAAAFCFYGLACQFDFMIIMTRGHRMIALANRRAWRSRDAPVLTDGRSISEAVLRPIG